MNLLTLTSNATRLRESALVAAGQAAIAIGSLAAVRLLTHLLHPSGYGVFAVVLTYVAGAVAVLVAPVAGLATSSYHDAVRDSRARELTSVLAATTLVLAAIPAIVVPLCVWLIRPDLATVAFLGAFIFFGDLLKTPAVTIANTARRRGLYAALCALDGLGRVIAIFVFVELFHVDVNVILVACAVNSILVALIGWWSVFRPLLAVPAAGRGAAQEISAMLRHGWSFAGIGAAAWLLNISDRAVLGALASAQDVGLYVAVYQITTFAPTAVATLLLQLAMPIVLQRHAVDPQAAAVLVGRAMRYLILLITPIALLTVVARRELLRLIAGEAYVAAAPIVPWLALGFIILGMTNVASLPFWMHKRAGVYLGVVSAAGAVNVLSNLILIPRIGYTAAAINTCVAYGVQFLGCWVMGRRMVPWTLPADAFLVAAVASVAALAAAALVGRDRTLICVAVASAVFGAVTAIGYAAPAIARWRHHDRLVVGRVE